MKNKNLVSAVSIIFIILFSLSLFKIQSSDEAVDNSATNNLANELAQITKAPATSAISETNASENETMSDNINNNSANETAQVTDTPTSSVMSEATAIENEPVEVVSPNGLFKIEMSGIDKNIPAGGSFPYTAVDIVNTENNTVLWSLGCGYYSAAFIWSDDSRYVAITGMARTRSDAYIIDTKDIKMISLPNISDIDAYFESNAQLPEDDSYVYYSILQWNDDQTVTSRIEYESNYINDDICWTYNYNIETKEITKAE